MRLQKHKQVGERGENGQTLLLFIFFIIVLISFIGLGLDLGFAYITKAELSKGVDAAALAGMLNFSQGTVTAGNIANDTFAANYRRSGRDANAITPSVIFSNDATTGNSFINVSATTRINTFFIRVLPAIGGADFRTLLVGANSQATRSKLVMSLVLDRSGSMANNGGSTALAPAVSKFIDFFDDNNDRVASVSFATVATTDVTMRHPFKTDVKNAASALNFSPPSPQYYTCSERGLTNALVQNNTVVVAPGENVVKVIVFFTDGMANTFYYNFNCGARCIIYSGPTLADPVTGASASSGCTVSNTLASINPTTGQLTANVVSKNSCDQLHSEAENRAERIAWLARAQGNVIYSIGMGNPGGSGECNNGNFPILNPDFLKNVANTTDSATHDSNQPEGDYAIAANSGELDAVFQQIAAKILLRLTR